MCHYCFNVLFSASLILLPCGEGSNELNPLLKGRWGRSKKQPLWPWADGKYNHPRGSVCRVCKFTFALAAFNDKFNTMDELMAAMAASDRVYCKFVFMSSCFVVFVFHVLFFHLFCNLFSLWERTR